LYAPASALSFSLSISRWISSRIASLAALHIHRTQIINCLPRLLLLLFSRTPVASALLSFRHNLMNESSTSCLDSSFFSSPEAQLQAVSTYEFQECVPLFSISL
jgi:hypothetical protein